MKDWGKILEELDRIIPKYEHYSGKYHSCINLYKKPDKPTPRQQSLFQTHFDLVYDMFGTLEQTYVAKTAKIRAISRNLKISEKEAKKLFEKVEQRKCEEEAWEYYLRNKEWYDFLERPDAQKLLNLKVEAINALYEEHLRTYEVKHWVKIDLGDETFGSSFYEGDVQTWLNIKSLTKEEWAELIKSNRFILLEGDPETLFDYDFQERKEKEAVKIEPKAIKCKKCGVELEHNIISLNQKLGWREFSCLKCAGVTEEWAESAIRYYKSTGCTMFE